MLRHLLAFLALLAMTLAGGGNALAHAKLIGAAPAAGVVLDAAPERLHLTFNEPVSVTSLQLVDGAGQVHAGLTFELKGTDVSIVAPGSLPEGTQALSYRVVSKDGHPVGGTLSFSIGHSGASHEVARETGLRPQVLWALRLSFYLCVLGGVGAAFFRAWIAPIGSQRVLMAVLALGFVVLVASMGVQGLDLLNQRWSSLLGLGPWDAAAVTTYGVMVGLAAAAILLAAASLSEPRPLWLRAQTGLAVCLAGAALASTGHAATASPQWLMRPAMLIHVAGVTIWAGAMGPLLVLTARTPGVAMPVLMRFSTLAIWAVLVLVAAGVTMATVEVGSLGALTRTTYGRLLLAKLLVVAGLLFLAAMNRRSLSSGEEGGLAAMRRLRLSVRAEIVLMTVVAGLVAGWRFTPPPRDPGQPEKVVHGPAETAVGAPSARAVRAQQ